MKMEQTERSETSAYKIQTQGNYPEGSIKHTSVSLFECFVSHSIVHVKENVKLCHYRPGHAVRAAGG